MQLHFREVCEGLCFVSYAEFFQAIKYANPDRGKLCVKYLVCVTMLGEENTDPFASREVKIYETDRTVAPMVKLYHFFNVPCFRFTSSTYNLRW